MNNRARVKPINSRTVNTALIRLFKNGFECSCAFPYASAFHKLRLHLRICPQGWLQRLKRPHHLRFVKVLNDRFLLLQDKRLSLLFSDCRLNCFFNNFGFWFFNCFCFGFSNFCSASTAAASASLAAWLLLF